MAAIGSLNIQLSLASSSFNASLAKAGKQLQQFGNAVNVNIKTDNLRKVESLLASIDRKIKGMGSSSGSVASGTTLAASLDSVLSLSLSKLVALPFSFAAAGIRLVADGIGWLVDGAKSLVSTIPVVGGFLGGLVGLAGGLVTGPLKLLAGVLDTIAQKLPEVVAGVAELARPLIDIGTQAVSAAAEVERLQIAFGQLTGSKAVGNKLLQDIFQFGAATPFETKELVEATQRLMSFGMTAERAFNTVKNLGDIVAAGTLPLGEGMKRVTIALGQMYAKGKVQTQEMNQLTEAGIPGWKLLEAYIRRTRGSIQGSIQAMVEAGKVSGFEGVMALVEGSRQFTGMMAEQSQTVSGLYSTILDAWSQLMAALGKKLVDYFDIKGIQQSIIDTLGNIKDNLDTLNPYLAALKGTWEAIRDVGGAALTFLGEQILSFSGGLSDSEDVVDRWYNFVIDIVDGMIGGFFDLVDGAKYFADEAVKLFDKVNAALDKVLTTAGNLGSALNPANWYNGIVDGSYKGITGAINWVTGSKPKTPTTHKLPPGVQMGPPKDLKPTPAVDPKEIEKQIRGGLGNLRRNPFQADGAPTNVLAKMLTEGIGSGKLTKAASTDLGNLIDSRLSGAKTRSEAISIAQDIINDALENGLIPSQEKASELLETFTGKLRKLNKTIKELPSIQSSILPPSLEERLRMLQRELSGYTGKGLTALEKFRVEATKLNGLRTTDVALAREKQVEGLKKLGGPLGILADTFLGKDKVDAGLDVLRQQLEKSGVELPLDLQFQTADFNAAMADAYNDAVGALKLTESKNPSAVTKDSKDAYSAILRFEQEGRKDPIERLIEAQKAQQKLIQRQVELAQELVKRSTQPVQID